MGIEEEEQREPATRSPSRTNLVRRYGPRVLFAVVVLIGARVFTRAPKSHELELRISDPATATDVELEWAPEGSEQDAASAGGTSWHFDVGKAPASVTTTLRGTDGRYMLDVTVKRPDAIGSLHRAVTLEDGVTTTVKLP